MVHSKPDLPLSSKVFSIPLEDGRYLIYAKNGKSAFVANSKLTNIIEALRGGISCQALGLDEATIQLLKILGILDATPEPTKSKQDTLSQPIPSLYISCSPVPSSECTYCTNTHHLKNFPPNSSARLHFLVAKRGIHSFLEYVRKFGRNNASIHFQNLLPQDEESWKLMTNCLVYLNNLAKRLSIVLNVSAEAKGLPENIQKIEWIEENLNYFTLVVETKSIKEDVSRNMSIDAILASSLVETLHYLEEKKFSYEITLLIGKEQIEKIPIIVDLILNQLNVWKLRIEPEWTLGKWNGTPSKEIMLFIEEFREAKKKAIRKQVEIVFPGTLLNEHTNFCGKSVNAFTISPDGSLYSCCHHGPVRNIDFESGKEQISKSEDYSDGHFLSYLYQIRLQRIRDQEYCQNCFARFNCAADCFDRKDQGFEGSERCHIVQELTKTNLLNNTLSSGGMYWNNSDHEQEWSDGQNRREGATSIGPNYELHEVPEKSGEDDPGIHPVLTFDGRTHLTRRSFLGALLSSAVAVMLLQKYSHAHSFLNLREKGPSSQEAFRRTNNFLPVGTWVDPSLLSMIGIEEVEERSIEAGFHLRWFTGEDLEFPLEAFPSNWNLIEQFVNTENLDELVFEEGNEKGRNTLVPPAFQIYRRNHYWNSEDRIMRGCKEFILNPEQLEKLNNGGTVFSNPLSANVTFSKNRDVPEIIFKFEKPVHVLGFLAGLTQKVEPTLESFARESQGPIFKKKLEAKKFTQGPWLIREALTQGHMDWAKVALPGFNELIVGLGLYYCFMEDDRYMASNLTDPQPWAWVPVKSIPFITYFQNWEVAKEYHFSHPMKNRYLDFAGSGFEPERFSQNLEQKYSHIFKYLQKAFLRFRQDRSFGINLLRQVGGKSLTSFDTDPFLFYNFWALDPIMATLLSQKWSDVPGAHNVNPPKPGVPYDYLITTGWQSVEQRLFYIVQNVSHNTTPPVLPPTGLKGKQVEGFARTAGKFWHRIEIQANPQSSISPSGIPIRYEVPLFDLARREPKEEWRLLTQEYQDDASDPKEQISDSPVLATLSHISELASLTPEQEEALFLEKFLRERDPNAKITEILESRLEKIFGKGFEEVLYSEPLVGKFNDWVIAPVGMESKKVEYAVRGIDIFGRVSDAGLPNTWAERLEVTVKHSLPTPEAVDIDVNLRYDSDERPSLVVRWKLGARQILNGGPVNHFNIAAKLFEPNYVPAQSRQFRQWKDHILKQNIPTKERIELNISEQQVIPLNGSSLVGKIVEVRGSTGSAAGSEVRGFLEENERVLTIVTDQCFFGIRPLIDVPRRYVDPTNPLDLAVLSIGGRKFRVIGFEGGRILRIQTVITVPKANSDPVEIFQQNIGGNNSFTLNFTKFRTHLEWVQPLTKSAFPELRTDTEFRSSMANDLPKLAKTVANRETLRLRVLSPFSLDVTGREGWFTSGGELQYQYDGHRYRIPIKDFKVISISADHLRFGTVHVNSSTPPTLEVKISNGGPEDLVIKTALSSSDQFKVRNFTNSTIVSPGSNIRLEATFLPTRKGSQSARLQIDTNMGPVNVGLSGRGVDQAEVERIEIKPDTSRSYLTELNLTQVIWDAPAASNMQNPSPIFPRAVLERAFKQDGISELTFRIAIPPIYYITSTTQPGNSRKMVETLTQSCGGEISFIAENGGNQTEIVSDVITRPSTISHVPPEVSFFIQLPPGQPWLTVVPRDLTRSYFYPMYQEEIPIDDSQLTEFRPSTTPKKIGVVVSSHQNTYQSDGTLDLDSLVSSPKMVQIPPQKPAPPNIPLLIISDPWVDPFEIDYTTLPKLLDNKKVVQYKVRLGDLKVPEGGSIEVLRAPQDAIRVLMIEQQKPMIEFNDPSIPNDPEDPNFEEFNKMSPNEEYRAIATRLVNTWGHPEYGSESVFKPIGKISDQTKMYFIDEIENIASGNVFYAVRSVREGTQPTSMVLLPYRVVIPDTLPPDIPKTVKVETIDEGKRLNWLPNLDPYLYAYEIYRDDGRSHKVEENRFSLD